MNIKPIAAFLFLVLAFPILALAQTEPAPEKKAVPERFVYEWTDSKGVIHLTEDPSKIPQKYRNKSKKEKDESRKDETESGAVNSAPQSPSPNLELEQRYRREGWRDRYLDWKEKLQRSEREHQALQQRRDSLLTKWGSLAVAPPAVREEVGEVDQDLQSSQAEIDEARHMIDVVLPEEARKAGVPPGWLRE